MKKETTDNLRRASNSIRRITTTKEDGLDYLNGTGLIIVIALWVVLLIIFGALLGGL